MVAIFPRRMVCYWDLEGVVCGESLVTIGEKYGCSDEMYKITTAGMQGEISFQESMRRRLEILRMKGITVNDMVEKAKDTRLTNGTHDILKGTADAFTHIAITGGLDIIIYAILNNYGLLGYFDRIYASRYRGGEQIEPNATVLLESKTDIVIKERETNGFNYSVFVFDGFGDAKAAVDVELPIAWNPKLSAAELTVRYDNGCVIRGDDLRILLPIIMRWSSAGH